MYVRSINGEMVCIIFIFIIEKYVNCICTVCFKRGRGIFLRASIDHQQTVNSLFCLFDFFFFLHELIANYTPIKFCLATHQTLCCYEFCLHNHCIKGDMTDHLMVLCVWHRMSSNSFSSIFVCVKQNNIFDNVHGP